MKISMPPKPRTIEEKFCFSIEAAQQSLFKTLTTLLTAEKDIFTFYVNY